MLLIYDGKYRKKAAWLSFSTPNIRNRKPEGFAHLRVFGFLFVMDSFCPIIFSSSYPWYSLSQPEPRQPWPLILP